MNGRPLIQCAVIMAGACLFFLSPASLASAATAVLPGETITFFDSEGGERQCRIKETIIPELPVLGCGDIGTVWRASRPVPEVRIPPRFIVTRFDVGTNRVEAAFSNALGLSPPQLGFPHYASAAVYNDFEILDPRATKNVVEVQISVTYDWEGGLFGTGNYDARILSSLEIEEIPDFDDPIGIGGVELLARDRAGDQGFTDVASGGADYDRNNETSSVVLKLHAGRTYRIWFKVEAFGSPLVVTLVEASVGATWSRLSVTVDEEPAARCDDDDDDDDDDDCEIFDDDGYRLSRIHGEGNQLSEIQNELDSIKGSIEQLRDLLHSTTISRPQSSVESAGLSKRRESVWDRLGNWMQKRSTTE